MVHTVVDGTFRQTNLTNESSEYLAKREELRLAEIELMRQRERVAELRRNLPEGAPIQDYQEGPRDLNAGDAPVRTVRLSQLFTKPNRSLVIYHFMFGKRQSKACPMCTAWLDGANGVAHHLAQNIDFAVVAAADLPTLRAHARERGWDKLRLLSAGNNTFKYDLGSEDREGGQDSTVSVFTRDAKGTLRHFYTAHPRMAPDIQERGTDLLTPIWHFMDLTPQGRGSWYASLAYASPTPIARSSSITSCSEKAKLRLAPCAPPGSTVLMVSPIISLRILTSLLSLPPISRLCAPTLASGAGTSCASLAPATTLSNTT